MSPSTRTGGALQEERRAQRERLREAQAMKKEHLEEYARWPVSGMSAILTPLFRIFHPAT